MEDTVTNYQFYMNVCRNPFGYSSDEVRTARLYICDHAESMDNLVGKLTRENEALKAELAEAKKDAERLKGLRELCGYVEDGSSQTIRITQDDATNNWIIRWNDKAGWVFSSSFNGAIDAAMEGK